MKSIFYGERGTHSCSIFLAGPTYRSPGMGWRSEALELIAASGFEGDVIVPEWRSGDHESNKAMLRWTSKNVVGWEHYGLNNASVVVFWMPFSIGDANDPASLPGFTTRLELGLLLGKSPTRLVVGMPADCKLATGAIRYYCDHAQVPIHHDLQSTINACLKRFL